MRRRIRVSSWAIGAFLLASATGQRLNATTVISESPELALREASRIARVEVASSTAESYGFLWLSTCGYRIQSVALEAIKGELGPLEFLSPTPLAEGQEYLVVAREVVDVAASDAYIRCRNRVGVHAERVAPLLQAHGELWVLAGGARILPRAIVAKYQDGGVRWSEARDAISQIRALPHQCTLGPDVIYCLDYEGCIESPEVSCLKTPACFDATGRNIDCSEVLESFDRDQPPNKRLQLTPNSSSQSIRGTVLAADAVSQRWRSALLGAAEPPVR